jgi:16S rRNA (adenine1518-N6/adenine1519-N6)-dimethyltransferase
MPSPRKILNIHQLKAKKQLGQNFLTEPKTAESIVQKSGVSLNDIVVEIGAGLGALTLPLAKRTKRVYAFEIDSRIIPLLEDQLKTNELSNVIIESKSVLDVDFKQIAFRENTRLAVFGNLPYHISSQVIIRLIEFRKAIRQAVLMFQKELAQRLTAKVGTKDYGRITVMLNYAATIQTLLRVDRAQFFPRPRVDSEVVKVSFRDTPPLSLPEENTLFQVIKAAFSKRRKTLKNALTASHLQLSQDQVKKALALSDIDDKRRAETLTVDEFITLTQALFY